MSGMGLLPKCLGAQRAHEGLDVVMSVHVSHVVTALHEALAALLTRVFELSQVLPTMSLAACICAELFLTKRTAVTMVMYDLPWQVVLEQQQTSVYQ